METKINTKAKKEIILIFFSIFLISLVYAIPPIPNHFIGDVLIDGQNASVGTQIEVYVNFSLESVYSVSEVGKYDLFVTTGSINDTIEFKIQDKLAGSEKRSWGETIPLDLSITTTTTTKTTPPSSGSSGGSGGGGGGGFISPPTTETSESNSEEDVTQEESQETEEQEKISPGITGAVVGFLGSGKGITAIAFIIVLGIGVMLIKFKPLKWIKNR